MSMDLDAPVALPERPLGQRSNATILCCNCGAPIDGTVSAGALCYDCIKLTVDITEGVQREGVLHTCRDCERWLQPPNQWITAMAESRELLALCLRKLRGLSKIRIVDAAFIWTEPHSRRIKLKITVQQEAFEGAILQQTFEVEFVVNYQQCPDCQKSFTPNTWKAVVQVRQKVPHKRTFLYLEQLILKHRAHQDTINIKETHEGLDFFFAHLNQAEKFVDFLRGAVPFREKKATELISEDSHSGKKSNKYTTSCELIPLCKDDLLALPISLAKQIGHIDPLCLCYRVGTTINIMDPKTLQTADISTQVYWRSPFMPLSDVTELQEFVVMDIEVTGPPKGRFLPAEATVARSSDLGVNDKTYFTRTHLGSILHPGDTAMGYFLAGMNFNNPNFEFLEQHNSYSSQIPEVILVKKSYVRKRKNKNRNWRLKRMNKDEGDLLPKKQDQERLEADFEMFLRDVEEDNELRNTLSLYKNPKRFMEGIETASMADTEGSEGHIPQVDISELLEDMDDLDIKDNE